MAEGRLMCSGSSLFLKSRFDPCRTYGTVAVCTYMHSFGTCGIYSYVCRYGVGYRMVIVKQPSCDTTKVHTLICIGYVKYLEVTFTLSLYQSVTTEWPLVTLVTHVNV